MLWKILNKKQFFPPGLFHFIKYCMFWNTWSISLYKITFALMYVHIFSCVYFFFNFLPSFVICLFVLFTFWCLHFHLRACWKQILCFSDMISSMSPSGWFSGKLHRLSLKLQLQHDRLWSGSKHGAFSMPRRGREWVSVIVCSMTWSTEGPSELVMKFWAFWQKAVGCELVVGAWCFYPDLSHLWSSASSF